MNDCAYIFLDESGNFDFSANGSRYFVLTSVSMHRPFPALRELDEYMHDCIESGTDIEYFHCYGDRGKIRNAVFDVIARHLNEIRIDCLVVEKANINVALQEDRRFYPWMLGDLLRRVMPEELKTDTNEVIVITDTIPVNRKRQAVEKSIRRAIRTQLPELKYRILHHQSRSHYGLQVADYCCWAIFRKLQKGESSWYDRIKPAMRGEFDVSRVGTEY